MQIGGRVREHLLTCGCHDGSLRARALGERQQRHSKPVIVVRVAIVVVRVEQPCVGAIVRVTTAFEPRVGRIDKVGVIAAPRLIVARDRQPTNA